MIYNYIKILSVLAVLTAAVSFIVYILQKSFGKTPSIKKHIYTSIMYVYLCFVLYITLIYGRGYSSGMNFIPFYSYYDMRAGNYNLKYIFSSYDTTLNIYNIIMFVPFGILVPQVFKFCDRFAVITLKSLGFSLIIELSQLIMKSGITDIDDIIHNTVGAIIGFIILNLLQL